MLKLVAYFAILSCSTCAYAGPRVVPQRDLKSPITVYASSDLASTYSQSVEYAIDLWNDASECELFQRIEQPIADVVVTYGDVRGRAVESAKITRPYYVVYRRPADTRHAMIAVAHGLGHVLGVGHDYWESSVMNPVVVSDYEAMLIDDLEPSGYVAVPSNTGRVVGELYCR